MVMKYANGKISGELCGFSKVVGGCTLNNLRRSLERECGVVEVSILGWCGVGDRRALRREAAIT